MSERGHYCTNRLIQKSILILHSENIVCHRMEIGFQIYDHCATIIPFLVFTRARFFSARVSFNTRIRVFRRKKSYAYKLPFSPIQPFFTCSLRTKIKKSKYLFYITYIKNILIFCCII